MGWNHQPDEYQAKLGMFWEGHEIAAITAKPRRSHRKTIPWGIEGLFRVPPLQTVRGRDPTDQCPFRHVPKLVRNFVIYQIYWHSQNHVHHVYYLHTYNATVNILAITIIRLSTPPKANMEPNNWWFGSMFLRFQGTNIFFRFQLLVFRGVFMFSMFHPGCKVCFLQRLKRSPLWPSSRLQTQRRSVEVPPSGHRELQSHFAASRAKALFRPEKMVRKWPFVQLIPTSKWMDPGGWLQMNNIYIYIYLYIYVYIYIRMYASIYISGPNYICVYRSPQKIEEVQKP